MNQPSGGDQPSADDARAWQRWLRAEEPTGPMPLVERLRGTPFQDPRRMDAPEDTSARSAIDFSLELGELLLRSGAGTRDVEASLIAVTTALGLSDVEVDITTQAIQLQYAPPGERATSLLRIARRQSRDHGRLVAVYRLVADLADGTCSREQAVQRLAEISAAPKAWPRWMVSVAYGLLAAAVCGLV